MVESCQMAFLLALIAFASFGTSLNLVLAGATGRLYEFWSGRRGGARAFATVTSPTIRLGLSFLGFVFFLLSLYLCRQSLVAGGFW